MKKRWMLLVFVLVIVVVGTVIGFEFSLQYESGNLSIAKINEMAQYLNDKYGYQVAAADCIYNRKEDYTYHDAFLYGTTYDVPNIAIFDYNGNKITVTERNGFLGDDGQLGEVNDLICGYFEELTELDIEYVEVRESFNGNITDVTLNRVLHHAFNEKLTEENIGAFVDQIWNDSELWLELIFYFKAEEDIHGQLEQITLQLGQLEKHSNLKSLRFYISDQDEWNIYYKTPTVHSQDVDENERESDEGYIWGHYHVVNEVEYHYPTGDNAYYQDVVHNSFVAGGYCMLNRGYDGGFADRQVQTINRFAVWWI